MVVSGLRLVNFRSYCDATVRFGPGLNVVVGENATGKTNLLEARVVRAPRELAAHAPRREAHHLGRALRPRGAAAGRARTPARRQVDVGFAPGQGKRVRWEGLEVASLDDLRGRSQVFIFVPESLLLVKGSPARRRAHLDAFAAALDPQYAAAARDLQARAAPAQRAARGGQERGRPGGARPVGRAVRPRRGGARPPPPRPRRGAGRRASRETAAALAPAGERFTLRLVAQLDGVGYDEAALLDELRARRPGEVGRGLSLFGPHRDDLRFLEVGPSRGGGDAGSAERTPAARPPAAGRRARHRRP